MSDLNFTPKPKSIAEVAISVRNGHDYACAVKEFIDEIIIQTIAPKSRYGFYQIPSSLYEDAPIGLDVPAHMAHLAGLAENLALLTGSPPPAWTEEQIYFLKEAVFFGGSNSREIIMAETGSAFRRRHLFCGQSLAKFFKMRPRPEA